MSKIEWTYSKSVYGFDWSHAWHAEGKHTVARITVLAPEEFPEDRSFYFTVFYTERVSRHADGTTGVSSDTVNGTLADAMAEAERVTFPEMTGEIRKYDNGTQSVTVTKPSADLWEVSWFISPENAGMLSTRDGKHAHAAFRQQVYSIKGV